MNRSQTFLILLACGAACGGSSKKSAPLPPPAPVRAQAPAPAAQPAVASPHVGVDDSLAKQCKLRFASIEHAPKFSYDEAALLPSDRDVLQQVATCLTTGPLKGRTVTLVGRTDPRGTDEYNLALGSRRAETVRSYLQRLGVPAQRLDPTTRGEIDANGGSEEGWKRDRRVDLELVN